MATRQEVGEWGERFAMRRLMEQGYELLDKSYRTGKIQVDLVMRKDNIIAFVEVKVRVGKYANLAAESVSYAQQNRLMRGALMYMAERNLPKGSQPRMDIFAISVVKEWGKSKVHWTHYPNAFDATDREL